MGMWQRHRGQHPFGLDELVITPAWARNTHPSRWPRTGKKAGIAASIGTVGDAYDHALMESTIGLFKTEAIKPQRPWRSLAQVELATAEWTGWYNHTRFTVR